MIRKRPQPERYRMKWTDFIVYRRVEFRADIGGTLESFVHNDAAIDNKENSPRCRD